MWQPIETAPKGEPIYLFGYNVNGQASPSGPYKYWFLTVGEMDDSGADDLSRAGCDCIRGRRMDYPTHWQPLPEPPTA